MSTSAYRKLISSLPASSSGSGSGTGLAQKYASLTQRSKDEVLGRRRSYDDDEEAEEDNLSGLEMSEHEEDEDDMNDEDDELMGSFDEDEDTYGFGDEDEDEDEDGDLEDEDLDVEQLMYDDDGELIEHDETQAPTHAAFVHEKVSDSKENDDSDDEEFEAAHRHDLFVSNYFDGLSPKESEFLMAASLFALPTGKNPSLVRKEDAAVSEAVAAARRANKLTPETIDGIKAKAIQSVKNGSSVRALKPVNALLKRRWQDLKREYFARDQDDASDASETSDDDDQDTEISDPEYPEDAEEEEDGAVTEERIILCEDIAITKQFLFYADRVALGLAPLPVPLAPRASFQDNNPVISYKNTKMPPRSSIEPALAAHWERNGCFTACSSTAGPGFKYDIDVNHVSRAVGRLFPLPVQRMVYSLLADYADVYFTPRSQGHRAAGVDKLIYLGKPESDNAAVTDVILAHALSHLLKSKKWIARNDAKITEAKAAEEKKLLETIGLTSDGLKKRVKVKGVKDGMEEETEVLVDSGLNRQGFKRKLSGASKVVKKLELDKLREQARELNKTVQLSDMPVLTPLTQSLDTLSTDFIKQEAKRRDQGFTRPTILFIVPMRCHAFAITKRIIELLPARQRSTLFHMKRFESEYGNLDGSYTPSLLKPNDYQKTFWGNNDDCFKLGISFGNRSVKLCTPLYGSDIIIASPLGLKLLTGNEGDNPKSRDTDFLSSIEMAILLDADLFSMQNFQHLSDVMLTLNALPRQSRDADFSRIRNWCLDGFARFFRQTIVLTNAPNVMLQTMFMRMTDNRRGRYRIRPQIYPSAISNIRVAPTAPLPLRQIFMRQDDLGPASEADENRFQKFVNDVWPKIKENAVDGHVLLYVASYFDYVRIRNYLNRRHVSFAACSEFTENGSVARARHALANGKIKFLLATDRFHFFNRFRLRSIKTIVFYGLPAYAHMYAEVVGFLDGGFSKAKQIKSGTTSTTPQAGTTSSGSTVIVLYTKQEAMQLERIVGTTRSSTMLTSTQKIHIIQ